jgi:molecular chaperone GrpE
MDIPMEDQKRESAVDDGAKTEAAVETDPAQLQRERDEYYELLLRKSAEFDNFRKRVERERKAQAESAAANMIEELLPLMDDLERALKVDTDSEAGDAYRRGVELIHRQLGDILRKRGVRPVEAVGEDFDPYYHQAVAHDPVEGRRDGEIIEEFRRGYLLGDRLLRPSMVRVAKG